VRSRSLQELREYRNALGRLLLLALQPYPRRPALTNAVVNLVGLVALPIITWLVGDLLLGAIAFLSVAGLLLLIAGTRVERQLRGDLGIQLDPKVSGHWIELGVRNGRRKTASFNATVESIEPAPPLRYPPRWAIPWFGSESRVENIEPRGWRYLRLGHGEISIRAADGERAGSVAFQAAGEGEIPFNYENTAECDARVPIRITVKVQRHDPPASTEARFQIDLEPDGSDTTRPRIMLTGEPQSTWG
jgi:hypothetical protein